MYEVYMSHLNLKYNIKYLEREIPLKGYLNSKNSEFLVYSMRENVLNLKNICHRILKDYLSLMEKDLFPLIEQFMLKSCFSILYYY